MIDESECFVPL